MTGVSCLTMKAAMYHARVGKVVSAVPVLLSQKGSYNLGNCGIVLWGEEALGLKIAKSLMFLMLAGLLSRMEIVIKSIVMFSDDLKLFCVTHFVMFGYK